MTTIINNYGIDRNLILHRIPYFQMIVQNTATKGQNFRCVITFRTEKTAIGITNRISIIKRKCQIVSQSPLICFPFGAVRKNERSAGGDSNIFFYQLRPMLIPWFASLSVQTFRRKARPRRLHVCKSSPWRPLRYTHHLKFIMFGRTHEVGALIKHFLIFFPICFRVISGSVFNSMRSALAGRILVTIP